MIVPVILSGGSGSRLWPLSREAYPKQFLPLASEQTMLQSTALRVQTIQDIQAPILVCNDDHRFMVSEQLRAVEITPATVILEPVGRNTAPAVASAALQAIAAGDDPILLVLPADHVIADANRFCRAVEQIKTQAQSGKLITFGMKPDSPETGYGYIKAGEIIDVGVHAVAEFVEKPDLATAQNYLATGNYYWNSGMFMFRASSYLHELERFHPEMLNACRRSIEDAQADLDFLRLDKAAFAACPGDSIDYAVMEKTDSAVVMPLDIGWNDIGSWSALWEVGEQDENRNVTYGDVLNQDSHNSYVYAQNRLVAMIGADNLIVVETPDAVLVAHKDKVQNVKSVVERLKHEQRSESRAHRKVYRPWGAYDSIDNADRFQVKRITVKPGASLSLQMHHHRAEHWIVVKGTARITRDDDVFMLTENESTFIPLGSRHRLENPGKIPLELIEVQSGSYLGEDDIVRFDDVYGRQNEK